MNARLPQPDLFDLGEFAIEFRVRPSRSMTGGASMTGRLYTRGSKFIAKLDFYEFEAEGNDEYSAISHALVRAKNLYADCELWREKEREEAAREGYVIMR